jgi:acetyl esterase/lipase
MIVAGDELIEFFVSRGYPVVVAAWRNEHYPTRMTDLFCALAWTQSHAVDYGMSQEIVVVGASMGGGYAALLAAVDDPGRFMEECPYPLSETDRVRAVVAFSGTFDYAQEDDFYGGFIGLVAERYVGGTPDELPEVWRDVSAVNHIDGSEPPFLLLHGENDTNVDPHQSEVFASVLHEAGVEGTLKMIPRATHMSLIRNEEAFTEMESFLLQIFDEPECPAQTTPAHEACVTG